MANLSQVELQNLRHLIGEHETNYQKLAQDALNTKQKLMTFLNI